jgi:hypothetical protein
MPSQAVQCMRNCKCMNLQLSKRSSAIYLTTAGIGLVVVWMERINKCHSYLCIYLTSDWIGWNWFMGLDAVLKNTTAMENDTSLRINTRLWEWEDFARKMGFSEKVEEKPNLNSFFILFSLSPSFFFNSILFSSCHFQMQINAKHNAMSMQIPA